MKTLLTLLVLITVGCGGVVRGPNPDDLHADLDGTGGTGGADVEHGTAGAAGSDATDLQDFDYCVTLEDETWVETECAGWCFSNHSTEGMYANDFCFAKQASCSLFRTSIRDQLGDDVSECIEL